MVNVLGDARSDQIRVAMVGAPFVTRAINRAVRVADEQAGFEPAQDLRVRVVHGQFKSFHEHRAGGKRPFAFGAKWMAVLAGNAIQRVLTAPSDHSGELTV